MFALGNANKKLSTLWPIVTNGRFHDFRAISFRCPKTSYHIRSISTTMAPITEGTLASVAPKTRKGRPNSDGGMATVSKKKKLSKDGSLWTGQNAPASAESLCDVRCTLDNHFSPNVEASRVSVAMLGTTARNRGGQEADQLQPSLLGRMSANRHLRCSISHAASAPASAPKYTAGWLLAAAKEKMANGESKLLKTLLWKKDKAEAGWLRKLDLFS